MPISNLRQLFEHKLVDLHSMETQIIEALPKMVTEATDQKLKAALREHLEVTKEQLERLNELDEQLNFKKETVVCEGIKGILKEGEKSLGEIDDSATKDAAIIAAAQSVEHYEMAGYMSAEAFARQLDLNEVTDVLKKSLQEEKESDAMLGGLAKGWLFSEGLNEEANK